MIELATSKAGHDKGELYVIVRSDEDYVYLVNGTNKNIDSPKKKKHKHIQIIKNIPAIVTDKTDVDKLDDVSIKRILKSYKQTQKGELNV